VRGSLRSFGWREHTHLMVGSSAMNEIVKSGARPAPCQRRGLTVVNCQPTAPRHARSAQAYEREIAAPGIRASTVTTKNPSRSVRPVTALRCLPEQSPTEASQDAGGYPMALSIFAVHCSPRCGMGRRGLGLAAVPTADGGANRRIVRLGRGDRCRTWLGDHSGSHADAVMQPIGRGDRRKKNTLLTANDLEGGHP
jgi:hypothetical protein